jgi:integral membrane sensor domain MASE1
MAWVFCFPHSKVSLFFPPHAVLLAILLLVPTRHWWAYVLGAAAGAFPGDASGALAAGVRVDGRGVRCREMRVGSGGDSPADRVSPDRDHASRRDSFHPHRRGVRSVRDCLLGCVLHDVLRFGSDYWVEWRNLGISNAVTAIVLVPALVLGAHHLFVGRARAPARRRVLEAALVGACTVALGLFVFDRAPAGPNASPALLYAPIPPLIWAALRFGLGGISVSMVIVTVLAVWGTMRGHGPFLAQTPTENALALQLFLLVTAAPLMLLAVVIDEERRVRDALRESANLIRLAADAGNLAMWVWDVSGNDVWMTEPGRSLFGVGPDARPDFAATFGRVHADDRPAREGAIAQALQTRGEYEVEYRVQDADGTVRWISGDSVQLQQVILNLMLNAFGAMGGTGLDGARRLLVRTTSIATRRCWSKFRTAVLASTRKSSSRSSTPSSPANPKDWDLACRSAGSSSNVTAAR